MSSSQLFFLDFTVISGQSVSNAQPTHRLTPIALVMPAGWDAADVAFQFSDPFDAQVWDAINSNALNPAGAPTYRDIYDESGNIVVLKVAATRHVMLTGLTGLAGGQLKLKSVSTADATVAVNQTADRVIRLLLKPLPN